MLVSSLQNNSYVSKPHGLWNPMIRRAWIVASSSFAEKTELPDIGKSTMPILSWPRHSWQICLLWSVLIYVNIDTYRFMCMYTCVYRRWMDLDRCWFPPNWVPLSHVWWHCDNLMCSKSWKALGRAKPPVTWLRTRIWWQSQWWTGWWMLVVEPPSNTLDDESE